MDSRHPRDGLDPVSPGLYDLTLTFQLSILHILPNAIFVALGLGRIVWLARRSSIHRKKLPWNMKLAAHICHLCIQVATIAIWRTTALGPSPGVFGASAALALFSNLEAMALSYLAHHRSVGPSILLNLWLLVGVATDAVLVRSVWLRSAPQRLDAILVTLTITRAILFVVEEWPKPLALEESRRVDKESSAGITSRGVFWWINGTMLQGARTILTQDILCLIDGMLSADATTKLFHKRWLQRGAHSSLLFCTAKVCLVPFALGVLPRLCYTGFVFAQPFLLDTLIRTVENPNPRSDNQTSSLIISVAATYVGIAVSKACYTHMAYRLLTLIRGGLTGLMFRKVLRLPGRTGTEGDFGAVTLMSTDVDTIVAVGPAIHDIWASFLEIPLALYLLYRQVGVSALTVLVPTLLVAVVSARVSPALGPARRKWNAAIQERVDTTARMLTLIKPIKMMGMTSLSVEELDVARRRELKISLQFRWIQTVVSALGVVCEDLTPVLVILTASLLSTGRGGLSTAQVFTAVSIAAIVSEPLSTIGVAVSQVASAIGSFSRIEAFLSNERISPNLLGPTSSSARPIEDETPILPIVSMVDATFASVGDGTRLLEKLTAEFPRGAISVVTGTVSCGKSLLLRAIAGEMSLVEGKASTNATTLAYCEQKPWLRNLPVRQNIVGLSPYEAEWYDTVVRSCSLDGDICNLPHGDETLIGTAGIGLSGGQRQRIALARAMYSRPSLLLLDDPFCGIDEPTTAFISDALFGAAGLVKATLNATVIMATNNHQLPSQTQFVTILDKQKIVHQLMPFHEYHSSGKSFPSWARTAHTKGKVAVASDEVESDTSATHEANEVLTRLQKQTSLARQRGDLQCYKIYLASLGPESLISLLLLTTMYAVLQKMPLVWLDVYTGNNKINSDTPAFVSGYSILALGSILVGSANIASFLVLGVPKTAVRLHRFLLDAISHAPFSFFSATDFGHVFNRQDMTLVDNVLPLTFINTSTLLLRALVELGLIATGSKWLGVALAPIIMVLYAIQSFYLRTSRQLRFLDLEARTPLYSLLGETLSGLSTIRSMGWSTAFLEEAMGCISASQKPFYLLMSSQRWLQLTLDLVSAGVAVIVAAVALKVPSSTTASSLGLAMINVIGLSQTLAIFVEQWTRLETSLGAIARVKAFRQETPSEPELDVPLRPDPDWPSRGHIHFSNVSASYSQTNIATIRNINLDIQPGRRVGVYGRTGSGKSSLVLLLLQMLELRQGSVIVDDLNLSRISSTTARSRFAAISQEPILFSGSVRHNLDPERQGVVDQTMIDSLKKVSLWSLIAPHGGLDADARNIKLSDGQIQLLAVARIISTSPKVVLLDEITSRLDESTERDIRSVLRSELHDRTLIEVTHRLDHMQEYDMVVIMRHGEVIACGRPEEMDWEMLRTTEST